MTESQVVEDPVLRQRYVFRQTIAEDGTAVSQVEFWVQPGGGVVPHVHPTFEERFEVHSGEVTFGLGREKKLAIAGEAVVVPAGTRHTYRNTGSTEAHVVAEARPGDVELQQFLEDAAALGRAGMSTRHALPASFSGLLAMAVMARHYRPTTLILMPPPLAQRLLLDPFARLGERRGYRPGHYAEQFR